MPKPSSLSFQAKAALVDLANGKRIDRPQLNALARLELVELVPALTLAGTEMAEACGWRRPPWED